MEVSKISRASYSSYKSFCNIIKFQIYRIVKNFGESQQFANFFSPIFLFCNMRRAQKREMHFNLFCVRIEVRILILQYFKRSSLLSNDSALICDWLSENQHTRQFALSSISRNTIFKHSIQYNQLQFISGPVFTPSMYVLNHQLLYT